VRSGRLALGGLLVSASLGSVCPAQPALAAPRAPAHAGQASVQPWPVTITIRTVPPLPGIRFTFDGSAVTTGAHGKASVTERHNFSHHTLRLVHTRIGWRGRRYRFVRWAGQRDPNQAFVPIVRGLPMRANYTVTAAFAVDCPVTPSFSYQRGGALDPARISAVTLRSSTGQEQSLSSGGATWLECQMPEYRDGALSSRAVLYSVQSIMVAGTNVTSAGAQRFEPYRDPRPSLVAYFHDLTITAHDALFGNAAGSEAVVTMPDHSVRRLALGPGHTLVLRNLPQGDYQVAVKAGGSQIPTQNVRLSRDQVVDLTAVSPADMAAVVGALAAVLAGLPMLSRQRRRRVLGFFRRLYTGIFRRLHIGLFRRQRRGAA
jgi:hypothetical protein